jgi:carbon monoxide dehydrogenase subunit G
MIWRRCAVQLAQSFEVTAPVDRVWQALVDVERVAPCLPGASITGRGEDGSYLGSFAVKIGPTSAAYTGRLEMTEVDEAARRATMRADGTDRRGQGGASATIVSKLTEVSPGRTRVEVDTDYRITGRLARFGRGGMIEDISQKLLRQFAENLQRSLNAPEAEAAAQEPPEPAPAAATAPAAARLDAGSLVGGVLLDRIRANPLPVLGPLALLVLILRRRRRGRRRGR